ncbi:S26 family signal peptidase [Hamadaea tsunoensis]|uniref:S26 family signal peptidase n=1 Tax=Hamadaea tsunoensis TaxID=53368 RepID=UPI0003FB8752|nr:S26 family signal peptidase [Hamadaea tsunoensis]
MIAAAALLTIGAVLLWMRRSLMVITVTGRSMEPSLRAGDRVLIRRVPASSVRTGQVAVLRWPGESPAPGPGWMVKRIAAVAGDPLPDPVRPVADGLRHVPEGRLAVLGDNTALSHDSRQLGLLDTRLLLGVVIRRLSTQDPGRAAGPWTHRPHTTKENRDAQAP